MTIEAWQVALSFAGPVFSLLVLIIMSVVAIKAGHGFSARFYKLSVIVITAGLAVFLTGAGFEPEQMGGTLALLGSIAGYVLGSANKDREYPPDEQGSI